MIFWKGFSKGSGKEAGKWSVRLIVVGLLIGGVYYTFIYEDSNKPGIISRTTTSIVERASNLACGISWSCEVIDGIRVKEGEMQPFTNPIEILAITPEEQEAANKESERIIAERLKDRNEKMSFVEKASQKLKSWWRGE